MKKELTIFSLFFVMFTASFSQGLQNVIVERYYVSNVQDSLGNTSVEPLRVGSVTYRIFLDMKQGYKFQVVYGIATHELRIATTSTFYNNEDRGKLTPNDIDSQYLKNNTVMLDSWISTGAASKRQFGILKSEDNGIKTVVNKEVPQILQNTDSHAGIPIKTQDGLILAGALPAIITLAAPGLESIFDVFNDGSANGNLFTTNDGGWSCLSGAVGPDTTNKVLIAQITTYGTFSFEMNVQLGTPTGGTEQYVAKNALGKENLFAGLNYSSANDQPAEIILTSPTNATNFIVDSIIFMSANIARAGDSVTKVAFFVNNIKVNEDVSAPYQYNYTAESIGNASIFAVAYFTLSYIASSDIASITITTGIRDIKDIEGSINIYPNPARSSINIQIEMSADEVINNGFIDLFDMYGRIMYSKHDQVKNLETIDISSLDIGEYIINVNLDGRNYRKNFIKR